MQETIFHKILRKEIPADIVHETDDVLAFKDIHPKAKSHILFIPKEHLAIKSVIQAVDEKKHVPGLLIEEARKYAVEHGFSQYKLLFDGQHVPYIHLHLMSDQ